MIHVQLCRISFTKIVGSSCSGTDKVHHTSCIKLLLFLCPRDLVNGIAMAISVTHGMENGCDLCTSQEYWAVASRKLCKQVWAYVSGPSNQVLAPIRLYSSKKTCITRRFAFHNSKQANIEAMVAKQGLVENQTRDQVLTATLYEDFFLNVIETIIKYAELIWIVILIIH